MLNNVLFSTECLHTLEYVVTPVQVRHRSTIVCLYNLRLSVGEGQIEINWGQHTLNIIIWLIITILRASSCEVSLFTVMKTEVILVAGTTSRSENHVYIYPGSKAIVTHVTSSAGSFKQKKGGPEIIFSPNSA